MKAREANKINLPGTRRRNRNTFSKRTELHKMLKRDERIEVDWPCGLNQPTTAGRVQGLGKSFGRKRRRRVGGVESLKVQRSSGTLRDVLSRRGDGRVGRRPRSKRGEFNGK
jgi:hypothetical protein